MSKEKARNVGELKQSGYKVLSVKDPRTDFSPG